MKENQLCAVIPRKNKIARYKKHNVYPYLLPNVVIKKPNKAWQIDTTSNCLNALKYALSKAHPEMINSDQGAQFTSDD